MTTDQIETTPELDALLVGSVVLDRDGIALRKEPWGDWTETADRSNTSAPGYLLRTAGPVTVLHRVLPDDLREWVDEALVSYHGPITTTEREDFAATVTDLLAVLAPAPERDAPTPIPGPTMQSETAHAALCDAEEVHRTFPTPMRWMEFYGQDCPGKEDVLQALANAYRRDGMDAAACTVERFIARHPASTLNLRERAVAAAQRANESNVRLLVLATGVTLDQFAAQHPDIARALAATATDAVLAVLAEREATR
jgi:hypothetical protein